MNDLRDDGGIFSRFEAAVEHGYGVACFVFDERVALDARLRPITTEDVLPRRLG